MIVVMISSPLDVLKYKEFLGYRWKMTLLYPYTDENSEVPKMDSCDQIGSASKNLSSNFPEFSFGSRTLESVFTWVDDVLEFG